VVSGATTDSVSKITQWRSILCEEVYAESLYQLFYVSNYKCGCDAILKLYCINLTTDNLYYTPFRKSMGCM
jgi:hypothetical protein